MHSQCTCATQCWPSDMCPAVHHRGLFYYCSYTSFGAPQLFFHVQKGCTCLPGQRGNTRDPQVRPPSDSWVTQAQRRNCRWCAVHTAVTVWQRLTWHMGRVRGLRCCTVHTCSPCGCMWAAASWRLSCRHMECHGARVFTGQAGVGLLGAKPPSPGREGTSCCSYWCAEHIE